MKGIILAVAITLRPRKGRNNNGVLRERNCTNEKFYYLPRRFENEAQPLLVVSKTCQLAEVLGLILYHAHRLELHSSRRTAELNLSSSLPSSLLFLHFSSLILTLPLLSLNSYFPLFPLLIFFLFCCSLS